MKRLLLLALIIGFTCNSIRSQINDLKNFPRGSTPKEIGNRLSERFIPTNHSMYNGKWIHYAEVCTWYGSLRFAEAARDKKLIEKLKLRFEPFFTNEQSYLPVMNHV